MTRSQTSANSPRFITVDNIRNDNSAFHDSDASIAGSIAGTISATWEPTHARSTAIAAIPASTARDKITSLALSTNDAMEMKPDSD